ncbi:MBL fold metallo-hydrolase [Arthrobacter sp. ZGTC412]|uniref:MBL fold metallo-hydrolase n=1 Tax=Arthrobacter sp. ZGTC412 TaxID=2058900 RepID=UPI00215802D9|nr:MBL fold metallo-hydrolase [Arthrobacter sp. ZGTC412]
MYNVGFGDCFLVTIRRPEKVWRMLVDCGVHNQGQKHSMKEIVPALISDITEKGRAHIDVLVATHHHADHIAGFALDDWENVSVGEVWLPFVEDESDVDAIRLREAQDSAAIGLNAVINQLQGGHSSDSWPGPIAHAYDLVVNSLRNQDAADRLLGKNGKRFKNSDVKTRYFPIVGQDVTRVPIDGMGGTIHVLGPSRNPDAIKAMNPPSSAGWLRFDHQSSVAAGGVGAAESLFSPEYSLSSRYVPIHLRQEKASLALRTLSYYEGISHVASILERSVNNTSLIFVVEIGGVKLLFPGDAQHGAWAHVLALKENRSLLADVNMYKIGHHGSHNGTPREFVEEVWRSGAVAFLPWGLVKRWQESIPKAELVEALKARNHEIICGGEPFKHDTDEEISSQDLYLERAFPIVALI